MFQFNISGIFKFLLGILFLQAATAIQVFAALRSHNLEVWILLATLSLALGVLTALWFTSILHHACRNTMARVKDGLSKQQEHTRRRAERDKPKTQERPKHEAEAKVTTKFGTPLLGIMGLVGLGTVVMLSQIITIGLLMFTAAAGGIAGYIAGYYTRKTQHALGGWGRRIILGRSQSAPDLQWEQAHQAIPASTRKRKTPPLIIVQQEESELDTPPSPTNRPMP